MVARPWFRLRLGLCSVRPPTTPASSLSSNPRRFGRPCRKKQSDWPLVVAAPGGLSRLISLASRCLPIIPLSEQTPTCLLPHWRDMPRHICTTPQCALQQVICSRMRYLRVKVLKYTETAARPRAEKVPRFKTNWRRDCLAELMLSRWQMTTEPSGRACRVFVLEVVGPAR